MLKYSTVFFDFDGVLCHDRFYTRTLSPSYQRIVNWIQEHIFTDSELCAQWMRGEIDSREVNSRVASACNVSFDWLHERFLTSVTAMQLDSDMISLVEKVKIEGARVGLVTNNMDVFSEITVQYRRLGTLFDVVVNSSDHRLLKKDRNGQLFDIALALLNEDIHHTLMIDDSLAVVELYRKKGGEGFLYTPKHFFQLQKFLLS